MPQNRNRQSSNSRSSRVRDTQRDHQQIADDNQQSGVVDTEEVRNHASEMEQAERSRENAGGGQSQEDESA